MIIDDKQLGVPITEFTGTTEEIDALSAIEGMVAYDTTKNKPVYYDGSNWIEIGGSSGETDTLMVQVFS